LSNQQELAVKIKSGDENAFELAFKKYYASMCGYANKYLSDLDQAEEVVQEVFLKYWDKRTQLDVSESLEAYLFRSVRNNCLNYIKYLKVRTQYASDQAEIIKEQRNESNDKVVELELQQKIHECIDQLPEKRKEIFQLSRDEGLKYKEIAEQLGVSLKTVEAQMGKALKFLRENLAEYLPALLIIWTWIIKYFKS